MDKGLEVRGAGEKMSLQDTGQNIYVRRSQTQYDPITPKYRMRN